MRIFANAGELADALALAASLFNNTRVIKLEIPALQAVHIKTVDDAMTIAANTLHHALDFTLPATVEMAGEVVVSGARLTALAASFSREATIGITLDGNVACVTSGRSRFRLAAIPVDDLPRTPCLLDESGRVELAREEMLALLRTTFAMSTESTRYYLCGILLSDTDDGLSSVATDGKRLARVVVPGVTGLSSDHHLIVPAGALKIVHKLLADKNVERIALRCSQTLLAAHGAHFTFCSRLIDGTYPDYQRIVPKPGENAVIVERAALIQAFERIAAVADPAAKVPPLAGLQWSPAEPTLRLCLAGWPDAAADLIEAEASGAGRIAANIWQLIEILDVVEGERVRLDASSDTSPMLVTDPADADFLAVQMPSVWPFQSSQAA
jgi:DNA polymerase-3 subunit beta